MIINCTFSGNVCSSCVVLGTEAIFTNVSALRLNFSPLQNLKFLTMMNNCIEHFSQLVFFYYNCVVSRFSIAKQQFFR